MTQNEKDLLLQDLCARLPYGIKFPITVKKPITSEPIETTGTISDINRYGIVSFVWDYEGQEILVKNSLHIKDVKPYLLPLSSMTEEQDKEYALLQTSPGKEGFLYVWNCATMMKWLIENRFDYNGLIPKGLANDATGKNIY
jgi:hypothetical protein